MLTSRFPLAALTAFALLGFTNIVRAEEPLDYGRDIRPILADHCFHCHGSDEGSRQGSLRLDLRETALKGGATEGPAIVPGSSVQSAMIERITSADRDLLMPPLTDKHPLTLEQIELLTRWIREGAPYQKHWAFEKPVKKPLPEYPHAEGTEAHPIDAFVSNKLAVAGLAKSGELVSPPTQPELLCRRLYLDLIGLPPSPEQVTSFVEQAKSTSLPQAAAELTDRLLSDSRYGEKWARHWLDVARYADSNGYEKDLPRDQWIWRNWVINNLNTDLPYDQFIIEQIAGDLLPNHTQEQMIATGFLRNGMLNEEGAIVPEQFRMEGMFDRVDVVGTGILGLSVKCAQCHTHKFDPITHTEYYQLFAFLNNTYEAQSWVYSPEQQAQVDKIHAGIAEVAAKIKSEQTTWAEQMAAWEKSELEKQSQTAWELIAAEDTHSSSELNHPEILADKSILTLGHRTVSGDVHLIARPKVEAATGMRIEILTHGDLPFNGPGRSFLGTWALTELIVEAKRPDATSWERIKLVNATADFAEPAHAMEPEWANKSQDKDNKRTCGPAAFMVDGDNLTAWRADRGRGRRNTASVAVVQFEQPLTLPAGTQLKVALVTNHGGDDNGAKNVQIGRFRAALTTSPNPQASSTPYAAQLAMQKPVAERTEAEQAELFAAWRMSVPELKQYNEAVAALYAQLPEPLTTVLNLAERKGEMHRDTFVLNRGTWDKPDEQVQPGVPAALHPMHVAEGTKPNRLTFAQWLVDKESPLSARVAVNRVWQAIFGIGLHDTPEDFGTRAAEPVHAELLDWLAVDFMENGWSQKRLIRQIVTSATYQQSSRMTPELLEKDPSNRLFTRGPRFRAEAEVVRDIALSTAGLLSAKNGGPSFFPPVPESVLEYNYFKPSYWVAAEGEERYRRSLYVFRKRSMPDPSLSALDAPNADFTCTRRARSNSPLAALTTLNETMFIEASRAMALRILREGGASDETRLDYAYRLCTSRAPQPAEREVLMKLIASRRQRIAEGWLSVRELTTGEATRLPELPPGTTPQDAAVWTILSRVLLNLDETVTKG